MATDGSAQLVFGFVPVFIFKSGFLEVASVSTQFSGHAVLVRDYVQTHQIDTASTCCHWIDQNGFTAHWLP